MYVSQTSEFWQLYLKIWETSYLENINARGNRMWRIIWK